MISVMNSAPKLRGFTLTKHPVLTALRPSWPASSSPKSKPLRRKFQRGDNAKKQVASKKVKVKSEKKGKMKFTIVKRKDF
jgi:hypothetical protein